MWFHSLSPITLKIAPKTINNEIFNFLSIRPISIFSLCSEHEFCTSFNFHINQAALLHLSWPTCNHVLEKLSELERYYSTFTMRVKVGARRCHRLVKEVEILHAAWWIIFDAGVTTTRGVRAESKGDGMRLASNPTDLVESERWLVQRVGMRVARPWVQSNVSRPWGSQRSLITDANSLTLSPTPIPLSFIFSYHFVEGESPPRDQAWKILICTPAHVVFRLSPFYLPWYL